MDDFRAPNFRAPISVDAHVAMLPDKAQMSGVFFLAYSKRLEKHAKDFDYAKAAGIPKRNYFPFLSYPFAEWLRLVVVCAQRLHADVPLGEGLRRCGQTAYDAFYSTRVGRAMFAVLGRDLASVYVRGAHAYRFVLNFAEVTSEQLGPRHVRYHFRGYPCYLATYQVGVMEGTAAYYGQRIETQVSMQDLANGDIDIQWGAAQQPDEL